MTSHGPGIDNPAPHVEGPADCRWLRMRFTPEALVQMADAAGCDVVIGEPDDEGFVEPIFTRRPIQKVGEHVPRWVDLERRYDARDQAWYWTKEWQAGERESAEDIAAGRVRMFYATGRAISWLVGSHPVSGTR